MTTKHTPTPWRVELAEEHEPSAPDIYRIVGPDDDSLEATIAETWSGEGGGSKADAAHIVRCVNAHDELVALLRRACDSAWGDYSWVDDARAALAKVTP